MCSIKKRPFGPNVEIYTLTNSNNMSVDITNYGGTVVSVRVPDERGNMEDVVLGFDTFEEYVASKRFFGCIVGRVANRIAGGKFTLNGKEYSLQLNNGKNSLHGGALGFNQVVWKVERYSDSSDSAILELSYFSKDGESGYPGNLSVKATYTLTCDNALKLDFHATTDQDTIINLTNHSYFNLAGGSSHILDHVVYINADRYLPVDENLIPTGDQAVVEGTPMDFRKPTPIGARIQQDFPQLKLGKGYDHSWALSDYRPGLRTCILAATALDQNSGRLLEVFTTQPGVQFYTGNFLTDTPGKNGKTYKERYGFCFETQHFPDAINQPKFHPVVLKKDQAYQHTLIYKFSVHGKSKI